MLDALGMGMTSLGISVPKEGGALSQLDRWLHWLCGGVWSFPLCRRPRLPLPTQSGQTGSLTLTDWGFIFPVIIAIKSESAIVIVQSAFLSEGEGRGRR